LGIIAVRLSGPSDLLDNDQLRPASYVTDIVANGQWIVQRDPQGNIASKPPVCAWISALWAEATGGRVTRLALALPAIIGFIGMAGVTAWAGARWLSPRAGWWGALALMVSPMGFKQATLVRTDSLYGFAGGLAGIALWAGARRAGWRWMLFWIVSAAVILVKGPLAMALSFAGLLAWKWPRDPESHVPGVRAPRSLPWHALGLVILCALVGAWFWAAWREAGDEFISRMLGRELVGHVVRSGAGTPPLVEFYLPPLYYLGRFAPGSVFTSIALWSVLGRPSANPETRRFERFLWWWFAAGMVVFCIAPHQRPDLMTPIWVPGSLLAGREIARMTAGLTVRARTILAGVWIGLGMIGGVLEHHTHAATKDMVKADAAIRALAADLVRRYGAAPPIMHVNDNQSLQFYLGRRITRLSSEDALACLDADTPCVIAVSRKGDMSDKGDVIEQARAAGIPFFELAASGGPVKYEIVLVGNAAARDAAPWGSVPTR